jgi:methionine-rich copper-binding protein CopC
MARLSGVFVATVVAALTAAPSAFAHASLLTSSPDDDEVVRTAPQHVVLRFDEPVETAFGSVRVDDGAARRVDSGGTTRPQPREVAVGVRPGLPRGTYTVAWRVLSADSHPVSGAFVFHVGKPGAGAAGVANQVLDDQSGSPTVDRTFDVVRFLNFAFILTVSRRRRCAGARGDCGCFGAVVQERVGLTSILRDAALGLPTVVLALWPARKLSLDTRLLGKPDGFTLRRRGRPDVFAAAA